MTELLNNRIDQALSGLMNTQLHPYDKDFSFHLFGDTTQAKVNVIDHEESIEVQIQAPGFTKNEISAEIDGEMLIVSGEKGVQEIPEQSRFLKREISTESFSRKFKLPKYCTKSKVDAKLENGILTLSISKKKPEKPKKLKIM